MVFCLLLLAVLSTTKTTFRYATSFGHHMVLQAGKPAIVWGWCTSQEDCSGVTVTLTKDSNSAELKPTNSQTVLAQPGGAPGTWIAKLPATVASNTQTYSIVAKQAADQAVLTDVLFGSVWVCSGQSNMAFLLENAFNGSGMVQEANDFPTIRLFTSKKTRLHAPQLEQTTVEQAWSISTNISVSDDGKAGTGNLGAGDDNWLYMSAVCYIFGREVHARTGLPVGLLNTNWGGTTVEFWMSDAAISHCPGAALPKATAWNGMVSPLLNMTIEGVIWYQGESNCGDPYTVQGDQGFMLPRYACTFPAMVRDWRTQWHSGSLNTTHADFPFGYVQLAAWTSGTNAAGIRWSQGAGHAAVPNPSLPNTFAAIAIDLGDRKSPFGSVHIRDKTSVGARLAAGALHTVYGQDDYWMGPTAISAAASNRSVTVTFSNVGASGLDVRPCASATCADIWQVCEGTQATCGLDVGSDGNWVTVNVTASSTATVTVARPAFQNQLVQVGEGYCSNYLELAHVTTAMDCLVLGQKTDDCGHGNATSVSVGKGSRRRRCICGNAPCGAVTGEKLGKNGWDLYEISLSPRPRGAGGVFVRYAWSAFPCEYKQCALYARSEKYPAGPFVLAATHATV